MITVALVLAGVAAGFALLPRRVALHASTLGTMSETWLAEARANER